MQHTEEKFYTVTQVAKMTGYGYHYILQLIREGRIKCVTQERRYYIPENEVLKITSGQHIKSWGGGIPVQRLKKLYAKYKDEIDQLAKDIKEEKDEENN